MMQPLSWQCLMILVTLFSLIACSASKRHMTNEPQQRKNLRTRSRFDDIAHSTSHQKERRTIVGGTPANPNRFPAVVFLSDRENQLSCGGTLISPTFVLTAAHCEVSLLIEVVIGRDTNTSKTSPLFQTDSNNKQEFDWGYQRIKIKQEIKHPFYDATTLSYDIMLLQLEHPPVFDMNDTTTFPYMRLDSSDVLDSIEESNETATLPQSRLQTMLENNNESKGHFIDNQDTLMALGWGYTQSSRVGIGNPSENLQQAMLGYVPNDECKLAHEQFLTYEGRIFDDMMCTYASQRDACYGDSGGPIILPGEDTRQHIQVGIISWGEDCGDAIFPGVGARVSYGYDWIKQWVCTIDGEHAPDYFDCLVGTTFSPAPSSMPIPPTVSPAPSIDLVPVIINIHLDLFAKEIAWTIVDNESQETINQRPYGYYEHQNEVREEVLLRPGHIYTFSIMDIYGDGIVNNGYYQILAVVGEGEQTIVHVTKFVGREQQRTFMVPRPVFDDPSIQPSSAPSFQPSQFDFGDASNDLSCKSGGHFCVSNQDCCGSKCHGGLCLPSSPSRLDQRLHPGTADGGGSGRTLVND